MKRAIKRLEETDFVATVINIYNDDMTQMRAMAIDEEKKQFVILTPNQKKFTFRDWKSIISYELVEDGNIQTSSNVGKGLVGAAIAGPAGLLLGMAGKKKQTNIVKEITVNITLDSLQSNSLTLTIYRGKMKKGSITYKNAEKRANEILGMLGYMQRNA